VLRWRFVARVGLATALVCLLGAASPAIAAKGDHPKLDRKLNERSKQGGKSQVIVTLHPDWAPSARSEMAMLGGKLGQALPVVNGQVVELANQQLRRLADHPGVLGIHWDRPTSGQMSRAATTVGARAVLQQYGHTGRGIGVAVIDSGITGWHDDLLGWDGKQRVTGWKDFVNGKKKPYDDFGHGTHVAGIVGGNGLHSAGAHAGVAPLVNLIGLKVLNQHGFGVISDVIAAIEYAIANRAALNIRVINLSVGAAVIGSYNTDPLTLAAKRAVDAGIVVVAAAGNRGRDADGRTVYGGITAPGNAPWVLTVGASSTEGTIVRYDDTIAGYSSRGPSAVDFQAKPDLVAPGTGIVSLSDPASTFYATKTNYLVEGRFGGTPYLSLSGTSMAAPVVSGTVALMLQANPNLTPNLVKAILQYTAQTHGSYNFLTQGAGFLNTKGAVDLARYFANPAGRTYPNSKWWGRRIHWGNQRLGGGVLLPGTNAWAQNIVWGTAFDAEGDNIVWGTMAGFDEFDNIVWGTSFDFETDNIVWGTSFDFETDNIVWGTDLGFEADNIVWGTDCGGGDCDNIVWGTSFSVEGDNIVWGTADDLEIDNIVWGTDFEGDNIVWGTSFELGEADNIVWGTFDLEGDNIVWGTGLFEVVGDNIVWGTSFGDDIVWGSWADSSEWAYFVAWVDASFEALFAPPVVTSSAIEIADAIEPLTEPVTEEPVTEGPVTEGPVTEEPVTEEPVTEEPVTEEPVTEQPVTEEPVTEEPVTEEPVTEGPAAEPTRTTETTTTTGGTF
jgi:serine protease AprX